MLISTNFAHSIMNKLCTGFIALVLFFFNLSVLAEPVTKIAFGSCLRQNLPQPVWHSIVAEKPDLFIFTGDNIYADTSNPAVIKRAYQLLSNQKGYQKLASSIPVYATWDDHDYGQNDAGEENPVKHESEQLFLDFFKLPENSPARKHPGVYQSYYLGEEDKRVQLILLDTRFFRGASVTNKPSKACPDFNYGKQFDQTESMLGDAQWQWLAEELEKPAALRMIISSIQVIPDQHCWEKWANYPLERTRLFDLLAEKQAQGVIFISGDRHLSEVSRLTHENINYPLYEITASGMNTKMYGEGEKNRYRVSADNIRENNFGMIEINWRQPSPRLLFKINKYSGENLFSYEVSLSDLKGEAIGVAID